MGESPAPAFQTPPPAKPVAGASLPARPPELEPSPSLPGAWEGRQLSSGAGDKLSYFFSFLQEDFHPPSRWEWI